MFSLHNLATLVHVTEEGSKRRGEVYEIAIWFAGQMPFMYRELAVMKDELDSLFHYLHFECCVHPQSVDADSLFAVRLSSNTSWIQHRTKEQLRMIMQHRRHFPCPSGVLGLLTLVATREE